MPAAGAKNVVVLVVEDDQQAREMFRSVLRAEGYKVVAVQDGFDALTYLEAHTPAAVVLDLGLPRLRGRDVLEEMAAQRLTEAIPVIVVTGDPSSLVNEHDSACILRKPINAEELINTVRRCISEARSRRVE